MIVTCEACFSQFNLDDGLIKPTGSKVRCSKCHKVFKVFPYVADEVLEDIPPQLPTELTDRPPEDSEPTPSLELPDVEESGIPETQISDIQTPDASTGNTTSVLSEFKDMEEFDFSDLEKLLLADESDTPREAAAPAEIEEEPAQEMMSESAEPAPELELPFDFDHIEVQEPTAPSTEPSSEIEFNFDFETDQMLQTLPPDVAETPFTQGSTSRESSNDFAGLTDFDLSELSLEIPDIKKPQSEPVSAVPEQELLAASEEIASDLPSDNPEESLELALSELSLDDLFADAEKQTADADPFKPESEDKADKPELPDFSLDDIEKSLDMDLSDLTLETSKKPAPVESTITDTGETAVSEERKPESVPPTDDTRINLDDIQAMDMFDLENLLEKQEAAAVPSLNNAPDSFARAEMLTAPAAEPSADTELKLEMEDGFLTFDELQLDTDGTKPDTIQERKESYPPPPVSDFSKPPVAPPVVEEPVVSEPSPPEAEKEIPIRQEIDHELEETVPEPKKGMSPAIIIALIVTLIALVSYGGYLLMNSMGIAIPFISKPAAKAVDPGNFNIKPFEVNGRFVDSDKLGKLFVVTGNVKNGYPAARSFIQVVGKIYTKDNKTPAKTETSYCGNVISDADMNSIDAAALKQRLQNRAGDNNVNQKVQPGSSIPFMIVFSNLPQNLEEYTAEVSRSDAS
jgi:predicted Zn finger-like uncharacterized protein